MRQVFLILSLLLVLETSAQAFSYATGGCASGGCSDTPREQWLSTNADEIDAALDAIESVNSTQTTNISNLTTTVSTSYLALAGGTMTGTLNIASGVDLIMKTGSALSAEAGADILATAMSATGQIDDNDLAAGAVDGGTGGEIADGSITAADIATSAVSSTDILDDGVTLTTDTAGDYVATVTNSDGFITVSGTGTEGRAVTLALASTAATQQELDDKSAASSTSGNIPKFSGVLGDLVDTGVAIDGSNNITTAGALSVGGSSGASTFTVRNMADLVWYECGFSGSGMQCGVDADGTPDGTIGLTTTGLTTWTVRNTADSGYVECGVVGTTMTCAVDADGTPDGTL